LLLLSFISHGSSRAVRWGDASRQQGQDNVIHDVPGKSVVEAGCGRHLAEDLGLDHFVSQPCQLPGVGGGQFPAQLPWVNRG
jgi:hypothetical protein